MNTLFQFLLILLVSAGSLYLSANAFASHAPWRSRVRTQGGFLTLPRPAKKPHGKIVFSFGGGRAAPRKGIYPHILQANRLSHNISPSKSGPMIVVKNANSFVALDAIAEESLRVAAPEFFPIRMMYHDVSTEFKGLNDTVSVVVPNTFTADDVSGSYSPADATETAYSVSLNKNKGKVIKLSDTEARKGLDYYQRRFATPLRNAIRGAVIGDMLGLVAATGGGTDFATTYDATVAAASFDWAALVDLRTNLTTAKAGPDRFAVIREAWAGNLLKDSTVKTLVQGGYRDGERFIREGYLGNLCGFDVHEYADVPTTSNLRGFYWAKESFAGALAVPVVPEDFPGEVVNVTDDGGADESGNEYGGTGIVMQFRRWYNTGDNGQTKGYRLAAEALYGIRTAILNRCGRIKLP